MAAPARTMAAPAMTRMIRAVSWSPGNLTAPQLLAAATLEHAIARYVAHDNPPPTYVAIPFLLTAGIGPTYPLGALADDPRLCSAAGVRGGRGWWRDDLTGVDWFCLLDVDHEGPCGWQQDAWIVADAAAMGYHAELTPIDDELLAGVDL